MSKEKIRSGWKSRTSWKAKLEKPAKAHVEPIPAAWISRYGSGTLVVPTPKEVDEWIRKIPKGRIATMSVLRAALAKRHHADIGCPLTTGIFARIAAESAEEDMRERGMRRDEVTPWWRLLKSDGTLNDKFPGGWKEQAKRLGEEGFIIEKPQGKKSPKVADWDKFLYEGK